MKLAIASKEDFRLFWSMYRAQQRLDYGWDMTPLQKTRCEKIILGRMAQLGSGFTRVVLGCETLIEHCCDKSLDHLDFSPKLKEALSALEGKQQ